MPAMDWTPLKAVIDANESFLISSHVRPDADALGSELGMRAIKPGLIETALAEISEEDYTTALTDILEKKAGLYKDEKDGWQKLAQLAIRRGFEPGLVFEAIKVLKSNPHA